ncbi:MAG: DUF2236 domain-containing protein, partial [Actinomycetota bacterium]|nr:DUF2236 domain-containing protein [Actinomycetota bacterium]
MTSGLFPPGAVIRRVNAEPVILLGGGRAVLMQLAHPSVAAGVAEHSGFAADPFRRLRQTLVAMNTIVYGTEEDARTTASELAAVHHRVRGATYAADDPELLLWVHATLVDTALRVHRRFLGELAADVAETYYLESTAVAELLGVPLDRQPPDLAAFRTYVRATVGELAVSDTARRLAAEVLHPRLPLVTGPLVELARQVTVGLLPPPLRSQFG